MHFLRQFSGCCGRCQPIRYSATAGRGSSRCTQTTWQRRSFLVYMLSPLPRHSGWAYYFARPPSRVSLPRYGSRVGLRIVLFEACSAFTRVTACTLALSPVRDTHSEGFSYFVTSIAAPVASGWSGRRVGLTPTGKRRLFTAHANCGHSLATSQM